VAAHAHELPPAQQGHDAGRGGLVEAQPLRQLVQGLALVLAHVDEDPELLRGEAVAAQPVADGLLDAPAGGPDQQADGFLLRQ